MCLCFMSAKFEHVAHRTQEGHIFHAITYGLNAMGPHASQITEEERWKIVLYVQEKLQHYTQE